MVPEIQEVTHIALSFTRPLYKVLLHNSNSPTPKLSGRKMGGMYEKGTQKHWYNVERNLKAFASNTSCYLVFSFESFPAFFDSQEHNFSCIHTVLKNLSLTVPIVTKPFYYMYLIVAFSSIIYYCSWSQHVLLPSKLWIPWSLSGIHHRLKFAFNNLELKAFSVFHYIISYKKNNSGVSM